MEALFSPSPKATPVPISGLVITFDQNACDCDQAISQLRDHSSIEVGQSSENKLAIVVDSSSKRDDQEIWDWVHQLPSVTGVSVAFVGFDTDEDDETKQTSAQLPNEN